MSTASCSATEPACAQIIPNSIPGTAQLSNRVIAPEGSVITCTNCCNRVIPVVVIRRNFGSIVAAVACCFLCLWPCAICILCCQYGATSENYCPICGRIIFVGPVY